MSWATSIDLDCTWVRVGRVGSDGGNNMSWTVRGLVVMVLADGCVCITVMTLYSFLSLVLGSRLDQGDKVGGLGETGLLVGWLDEGWER